MKKCLAVLGSVLVSLVVVLLCVCCVFYSNARLLTAHSGWSEWSQAIRHSLSDFQNSERRREEGGGHTYIITHSHGGQLTRATKNLMLQQKLTEELSPFLSNATLVFSSWLSYRLVKTWLSVDSQCNVLEKYPAERLAPSSRIQEHMKSYRSNVLRANKTMQS